MTEEQAVQDQGEMMQTPSLDEVNPPVEAKASEEQQTEVVAEVGDPPAEETAEDVAAAVEDAEVPEGGEVEAKAAEAEVDPTTSRLDRIEKMLARLEQTSNVQSLEDSPLGMSIAGSVGAKARTAKAAPKVEAAEESVHIRRDIKSVITKEVFNKALESHDGFGDVMQAVYNQAVIDAQENMLKGVPGILQPVIDQKFMVKNLTDDLFRRWPSLFERREEVGRVARNIQVRNPDMSPVEVFVELNKQIESDHTEWIEVDEGSEAPAVKKKSVGPAIPRIKKRTAAPPKLTAIQTEMAEMAKAGVTDFE